MLRHSEDWLSRAYDLAMLDLDGVVYVGGEAVEHAAEALGAAREAGQRIAFITNNASRTPGAVADQLTGLGVEAGPDDVVTSALAAAAVLRDRLGSGARVAVLGADGLRQAVAGAGLTVVGPGDDAETVVTGYDPDVPWRDVMRVATRIRDGLPWLACNTDETIPTAYGIAPGHGALVELLRRFSGVEPEVAGKPARPLLDETIRRVGGERPLMVGDRLDTDIAGAVATGLPALLVMTGVTGLAELAAAPREQRPAYLAADLRGLNQPHPAPSLDGGAASLGGWVARVSDGRLAVEGSGDADDWWRVVAAAAWDHADRSGNAPEVSGLEVPSS